MLVLEIKKLIKMICLVLFLLLFDHHSNTCHSYIYSVVVAAIVIAFIVHISLLLKILVSKVERML